MAMRRTMPGVARGIAERRIEGDARRLRALRLSLGNQVVAGSELPDKPALTPEQVNAIYADLAGAVCRCGANKQKRQSLCRTDYFRLPVGLRRALYDQDGYAEAFLRACEFLKLTPPEA